MSSYEIVNYVPVMFSICTCVFHTFTGAHLSAHNLDPPARAVATHMQLGLDGIDNYSTTIIFFNYCNITEYLLLHL